MKTSLFIKFIFTLSFIFGLYAQEFNNSPENDMENYLSVVNIEKDILYSGDRTLDIYYNKDDVKRPKSVVIHIYGGSWVSGNKITYTNIGSLLENEDYVAVLPNYILFPNGSIDDMVDDIYKAIEWTYTNIAKYGGNPNKISISAHSAGAHITALAIIKAALNLSNNGATLSSLPYLEKVLLLNGPYIFDQEFLAYTLQGTGSTSNATVTSDPAQQLLLQKLMVQYYNNADISPIEILKGYENNSITNHFNVGKFTFVYTSLDNVVPESSAKKLISEIDRTSETHYEYVYLEGLEHATMVRGIRAKSAEYENMYIDLLRK
ncbi:alpha/beta-hydrolase [Neocallimastix californiae]|uniref:Alpha/beta-hydrolase n=1 Tax=Neocallimastix californiae TaxID=1754190 RepID=A0A1Y2ACS7_9FUNG|nr:alpha/beta-hydrolase [Neocallimastix californiae]|eukprot:ORY20369.1 alpha/beta-hydrolase [Neocallimastix californiae]